MNTVPQNPAARSAPASARAALQGGPAATGSPPLAAGGKTSPGRGRAAPGMPGPETAALSPAAVRARAQSPAGAEPASPREASSAVPAGSTAIAAAMSEDRGPDSLDAHLRRLMKDLGLTGFHVEKSLDVEKNRKNVSVKGWPDWTIRGPRGVLFRELKSQRGRVAPEQQEWLDGLAAAGHDADTWRPSDLLSGRVARELTAISSLRAAGGAA